MNPESCFDKSVCCVCTRSICMDLYIYPIVSAIISAAAFVSVCLQYNFVFDDKSDGTELYYNVGLYMHFIALFLSLVMTSYLGRYLSGSQHKKAVYSSYHGYAICCVYAFAILFMWMLFGLGLAIGFKDTDPTYVKMTNNASKVLLLNFGSFVLIWLWSSVFKPLIPNLCYVFKVDSPTLYLPMDNDRADLANQNSHFVNVFTRFGFYESNDDTINRSSSSLSLMILFTFSIITANVAVRFYKVDAIYYYVLVGLSAGSAVLSVLLQLLIILAYSKDTGGLNREFFEISKICWLAITGCLTVLGLILFFVFFPYNGWSSVIDKSYELPSTISNIFFMVQGSISLLIAAGVLIWGCTYLPRYMSACSNFCAKRRNDAADNVYGSSVNPCPTMMTETDQLLD